MLSNPCSIYLLWWTSRPLSSLEQSDKAATVTIDECMASIGRLQAEVVVLERRLRQAAGPSPATRPNVWSSWIAFLAAAAAALWLTVRRQPLLFSVHRWLCLMSDFGQRICGWRYLGVWRRRLLDVG
jgi:hypothetical protein